MAYLVKSDLHTHLYPEIIDEIIRKSLLEFATQSAFPATGVKGYIYKDLDAQTLFSWSGSSYIAATDPDVIVTNAINAGIAEVKSYLNRFDLVKIFGSGETEPEVIDEHLKNVTKDVACWHLVKLSNPNVDLKLFRTGYEDAIAWLKLVQKGQADPDGWPYKEDDANTPGNENTAIQWSSNKKKNQHF